MLIVFSVVIDNFCAPGFVDEDSPYASSGQKGTYYFEFSRPLRTMDRLQQVPTLLLHGFLFIA